VKWEARPCTPAVDVARISENVGPRRFLEPQLLRQLRQNDALALLSINGSAYDDVLTMPPIYVGAA